MPIENLYQRGGVFWCRFYIPASGRARLDKLTIAANHADERHVGKLFLLWEQAASRSIFLWLPTDISTITGPSMRNFDKLPTV